VTGYGNKNKRGKRQEARKEQEGGSDREKGKRSCINIKITRRQRLSHGVDYSGVEEHRGCLKELKANN